MFWLFVPLTKIDTYNASKSRPLPLADGLTIVEQISKEVDGQRLEHVVKESGGPLWIA